MLFWPIVLALGPRFGVLYYDHGVKPFVQQTSCERALPRLEKHAKRDKEFMAAFGKIAGKAMPGVSFHAACIDKKPQQFRDELENRNEIPDNETQIKI